MVMSRHSRRIRDEDRECQDLQRRRRTLSCGSSCVSRTHVTQTVRACAARSVVDFLRQFSGICICRKKHRKIMEYIHFKEYRTIQISKIVTSIELTFYGTFFLKFRSIYRTQCYCTVLLLTCTVSVCVSVLRRGYAGLGTHCDFEPQGGLGSAGCRYLAEACSADF